MSGDYNKGEGGLNYEVLALKKGKKSLSHAEGKGGGQKEFLGSLVWSFSHTERGAQRFSTLLKIIRNYRYCNYSGVQACY